MLSCWSICESYFPMQASSLCINHTSINEIFCDATDMILSGYIPIIRNTPSFILRSINGFKWYMLYAMSPKTVKISPSSTVAATEHRPCLSIAISSQTPVFDLRSMSPLLKKGTPHLQWCSGSNRLPFAYVCEARRRLLSLYRSAMTISSHTIVTSIPFTNISSHIFTKSTRRSAAA